MNPGHHIDYKALRWVNPETARLAVLEYLKTNGGNISDAAREWDAGPEVYSAPEERGHDGVADSKSAIQVDR